ncbi:Protein of unknown function [Arthrobacter subterraneus]|uniref:DUF1538 domain-containing protein n=1 Tax=Arthrobacter subterraneus TaxID=335973 RepID=A0A1G8L9U7_9MICC|nr:DUF1538 domain-containing protein [Arthrobacter subterraneus]SDI51980.1 Protein of unknown function [Arthrobacter subterraneus]
MEHLSRFAAELLKSLGNLVPIVAVVVIFQVFVFRAVPDNPLALLGGLAIVAVGIALFLHGLDLSIFPVGKNLANQFVRRGSLGLLLPFGFAIGFAASIAEPAVIAVAEQAQLVSAGRINAVVLRFVIAVSVGLVLVVGVLRVLRGWAIHKLLIAGYAAALGLTFIAPPEIVGLAYDSGGVTTNIVSVPLIAAIGLGLANSLRGRSVLIEQGAPALILLFAVLIGFAVTMAEPALLAIGEQAEEAAPGRVNAFAVRMIVACGVALGIGFGTYRILVGGPFHYFIMAAYAVALLLVFLAPKYVIPLAFDLGGVTTSEVTVPLVTALGIGLATAVEGRNELIDGFGLIAYASIFPVIAVMVYAMVMEQFPRLRKEKP